jgi:signal transduction histidine kinase
LRPLYRDRIVVHQEFGRIPNVMGLAGQLNQVFMNLLANAGEAIAGPGEVWIKTWQQGERVYVSIRDSGPGIPPENLGKIFDPFFTTKEVGKGTGLGLAIAYGIVEKHGGEIRVESQPGEGACFIISLPVRR